MGKDKALVLRTVYLDSRRDEELRKIAFEHRMSKGELIRRLIDFGIEREHEMRMLGLLDLESQEEPKTKNDPNTLETTNEFVPAAFGQRILTKAQT